MLSRFLDPERRKLAGQVVRYGLTGLLTTGINIGVYHLALDLAGLLPNVAFAVGFIAALIVAYPAHSRYSFRDHGTRDNHLRSGAKFVAVSLGGFALNTFWVWLLVEHLKLPSWAPDIPVLFVTPLVAFSVSRAWVFK